MGELPGAAPLSPDQQSQAGEEFEIREVAPSKLANPGLPFVVRTDDVFHRRPSAAGLPGIRSKAQGKDVDRDQPYAPTVSSTLKPAEVRAVASLPTADETSASHLQTTESVESGRPDSPTFAEAPPTFEELERVPPPTSWADEDEGTYFLEFVRQERRRSSDDDGMENLSDAQEDNVTAKCGPPSSTFDQIDEILSENLSLPFTLDPSVPNNGQGNTESLSMQLNGQNRQAAPSEINLLDMEASLPAVNLSDIVELTEMPLRVGLDTAEEYLRLENSSAGATTTPDEASERLIRLRSLFILHQESLAYDYDPGALRTEARVAITEDVAARGKLSRAYLHRYRHRCVLLSDMYAQIRSERDDLVQAHNCLKYDYEQITNDFKKVSDGFLSAHDCQAELGEKIMQTEVTLRNVQDELIAKKKEEEFAQEEICRMKDVLTGYAQKLNVALNDVENAKKLAKDWEEYAETNRELAEVERQRREGHGSPLEEQDDTLSATETTAELRQYITDLEAELADRLLDGDASRRTVDELEQELQHRTEEKARYEALLKELQAYCETGEIPAAAPLSLHSTLWTKLAHLSNPASPSPKRPTFAPRSKKSGPLPQHPVEPVMPVRWRNREVEVRNSEIYLRTLEILRSQRSAEREKEERYQDLQHRAYQVEHEGSRRPYIPRRDRMAQLETIISANEWILS